VKQEIELYKESLARMTALRYQLDGIVDGSANPEMQEAAYFLDRINDHLSALLEATQGPDEICPRCGVSMQATHAPWCEFGDGTPVPNEDIEMMYALTRCKTFIVVIAKNAMGDDRFLWALSELMKHLAEWVYPLRQPF